MFFFGDFCHIILGEHYSVCRGVKCLSVSLSPDASFFIYQHLLVRLENMKPADRFTEMLEIILVIINTRKMHACLHRKLTALSAANFVCECSNQTLIGSTLPSIYSYCDYSLKALD